jgi:CPA2 family monovalent cation:H+ antiporter-2
LHETLFQMTIYLAAAVIAVPLARRLGFGSVLGYLAAGVVIGPVLGLVGGAEAEDVSHYAEYGVVLMLFLIGLEMEPKALWGMRRHVLGLGGLQVAATGAAVALAARLLGLGWAEATAVGMILSLSSTAIVMQTLSEKELVRTEGGRASFAVLLFQDMAAIPFLALLPLLAIARPAAPEADLFAGAPPWLEALMVAGVTATVLLAGRFLTRPFFTFVSWSGLHEIYVAAALLFVAGVALAMTLVGLSPALGSFLAGVVLARSEYRHELEADLAPFKGLLLGLFFLTVGAQLDLALLEEAPLRIAGLTLGFIALKAGVLALLARAFGLRGGPALLFALALAQAGEFGFFLLGSARTLGVLPGGVADTLLLVISLSMMLTPALFLIQERLARRPGVAAALAFDVVDQKGKVIVAGMGRFGQTVNRVLSGLGYETVILDHRPATVAHMRALGHRAFYGDVGRMEMLAAAGVAEARAVVICIDDFDRAEAMSAQIAKAWPQVKVIVRARDRHQVYRLRAAGAHEGVREVFYSGVTAAGFALDALGHDETEVERVLKTFIAEDRGMIDEIAAVWDPDLPPERNPAYLAAARDQAARIEAALRQDGAPKPP